MVVIDLQVDTNFGLGMTVSTVACSGIVVQSLMKNGPAERDGRLRIGDQLNSIDSQSLEGATQAEVNELIRHLEGRVRIVASRPISSPDLSSDKLSDRIGDRSLNFETSDGNQSLKRQSMDNSDLDLENQPSQELLDVSVHSMARSDSHLTAAVDRCLPAETTGMSLCCSCSIYINSFSLLFLT